MIASKLFPLSPFSLLHATKQQINTFESSHAHLRGRL